MALRRKRTSISKPFFLSYCTGQGSGEKKSDFNVNFHREFVSEGKREPRNGLGMEKGAEKNKGENKISLHGLRSIMSQLFGSQGEKRRERGNDEL